MIDVDDEFDEDVKDKTIADLIIIAAHVICDDVIDESNDVINVVTDICEEDVTNEINAWFNITVENDIIKCFFEDDELDVL